MRIYLLFNFILSSAFTFGQSLKAEIDNAYNFKPSKLSKKEEQLIFPSLDKFWNKVKSNTEKYLPELRNELATTDHNPYFYYDGAVLLLSISKDASDNQLVANALVKCDLDDMDQRSYVQVLNQLSIAGANVTSAAVKILNDTSFSFFIVQHVMYFRQGDCLTFMLLPQRPEFYVDTLISLFKIVNPNSQKSVLYTLWFSYTCKGDSLIKAAMDDGLLNKEVSSFAKDLMNDPPLTSDIKNEIKTMNKKQAEELRSKAMERFSDEAADDLLLGTLALRAKSNCR